MKPLADYIRSLPDFPKPGIIFRDIVPLIENQQGLRDAIDTLREGVSSGKKLTNRARLVVCLLAPLAYLLNAGVVLRKACNRLQNGFEEYSLNMERILSKCTLIP